MENLEMGSVIAFSRASKAVGDVVVAEPALLETRNPGKRSQAPAAHVKVVQ